MNFSTFEPSLAQMAEWAIGFEKLPDQLEFVEQLFHIEVIQEYSKFRSFANKPFNGFKLKRPFEKVSSANSGYFRHLYRKEIKRKLFERGMPYIHIWYYPSNYKSVFSFRVDTDSSRREDCEAVFHLAQKNKIHLTWFIDVAARNGDLSDLPGMSVSGEDIQLHCFNHQIFADKESVFNDIRNAYEKLESVRIHPSGYAAPYGVWSENLNAVLEELNFIYSSEFSLAHDDFPYFPLLSSRISRILQVPIHPICLSILAKASFTHGEMKSYFQRIIKEKYVRRQPIMLYGHPLNEMVKYQDILDFVFSQVSSRPKIWKPSYTEFAQWWIFRNGVRFTIRNELYGFEVKTDVEDKRLMLRIEFPNGEEAFTPMTSGFINFSSLEKVVVSRKANSYYNPLEPAWKSYGFFVLKILSKFRSFSKFFLKELFYL
ncbi:MAG: polysaccharide deacetylase family protein [Candidatus Riflebacteria bacterium]|nr:polysaccharide deacetylase family protein [Candidatus Riflebacteria bacterium]